MRLMPFVLIGVVFLLAGGCERKTKLIYAPNIHDTTVVHDTLIVHKPCRH